MTSNPSRRNFLFGKAGQSRQAAESASVPAESADLVASDQAVLVHVGRRAMACQFEISLNAGQYPHATEAAIEALDLVSELEQQLSVFLPTSEISRINATAAQEPVEVEPRLFELLQLAVGLFHQTGGAYDITSGPLWEVWGFARRAGEVPSQEKLAEARRLVGGHLVQLDAEQKTIHFLEPGVRVNLGSIGKGYAIDRCCERLRASGIEDFLASAGGSSVRASGLRRSFTAASTWTGEGVQVPSPAATSPGFPWAIGVRDPLRYEQRLGVLRLTDQALGTSGTQYQFFHYQGRRYGHILDPRSGWPAEGVLTATVIAPSAAMADAVSTAFYVLGPDTAAEYCQKHAGVAAILFSPGTGGIPWQSHPIGLAGGQWQPVPGKISS